jgi:prepilin-type N-terminal cleavage/methylation domain-containing protein
MQNKGLTIIEMLIAIFIISVGIVGVFTVINKTISTMAVSPSELIAAYLAQEGIEVVRNIRDTNWLEPPSALGVEVLWDDGLAPGNYKADYNDNSLTAVTPGSDIPYLLNINNNGYYTYDSGINSGFYRKITISQGPILVDSLKVFVDIWWTEKDKINHVTAEEKLYNWH